MTCEEQLANALRDLVSIFASRAQTKISIEVLEAAQAALKRYDEEA